jgi:hypothetical protein
MDCHVRTIRSMRRIVVLVLFAALSLSAAAPKKKPPVNPMTPADLPHPIAQFLRELSRDGNRQVTFRAQAVGTRFYFEEAAGVSVYRFENGHYVREEFLRGTTLAKAIKRYAKAGR